MKICKIQKIIRQLLNIEKWVVKIKMIKKLEMRILEIEHKIKIIKENIECMLIKRKDSNKKQKEKRE